MKEKHICEHEGCQSADTEEYRNAWADENYWYCADHAVEEGFCLWCHHFGAGSEDYDFSPMKGYHGDCYDELRAEVGEDIEDEDEGDWDMYAAAWYDEDMHLPDDEDVRTHTDISAYTDDSSGDSPL